LAPPFLKGYLFFGSTFFKKGGKRYIYFLAPPFLKVEKVEKVEKVDKGIFIFWLHLF